MRIILAVVVALIAVGEAPADGCVFSGGRVGEVRYMHIPKVQRDAAKIFTVPGLPKIHDHAVLKERGYVLSAQALSDSRLAKDLAVAVEQGNQLPWGDELDAGAEIVILGYRVFPELKELFARVLVLK
jgi:hypothetical protein